MNAHRRTQRFWPCLAFGIALSLPLSTATVDLNAASKPSRSRSRSSNDESTDAGTSETTEKVQTRNVSNAVRMNHMRTPWGKVLQEAAKDMNKELVADVVPAGTFSRWDFKSHEPSEAVRIFNRELEPLGFRLLDKRDHLVLIEVKKSRMDYRPAAIKSDLPAEDEADDEPPEQGAIKQVSGEVKPPAPAKRKSASRSNVETADATPLALRRLRKKGPIEQVSAEQEESPAAEVRGDSLKLSTVRLKARDAVAISRIIYNLFKDRAELVDDGPQGLQGFRVFRSELDAKGKPLAIKDKGRFTIGIDEEHNQLIIEATAQETPSILRLVRTLDVLPKEGEGTVRAVSTRKDAGMIASALQPEIDRLAAASRKAARKSQVALRDRRDADDAENEFANAENAENEENAPPTPRRPGDRREPDAADQPGTAQSLIKSLKGDVDIQSIPDLGIMVIIGNEQDAETVISVIREIERLSAGAVPSVELVFLRHINSESLASLLTTVYDRLSPQRGRPAGQGGQQQSQNVLVIPIVRPNAVLIVAAKVDIDSAKDLAEQLDQPSDPHLGYEVFRLKYAIPSLVVETVEGMYGTTTTGQGQQTQQSTSPSKGALSPQVKIIPDLRTNSVIVQARPRDMREVALLIRQLDVADSAAISQIRIFTLKTAVADELSATLQTAIQSLLSPARIPTTQGGGNQGAAAQGGGNPELREVKSMILQYLDQQNGTERMLQSGILADIRITADMRTNSIVVTAPEQSMELVARLIEEFDRPNAAVAEIKIFTMTRGDAQATLNLLNGLFGLSAQQRPGGQGGAAGQFGQNFPGVQIAGADDASSTLIPIRFNVDVRTNSIVAIGGAEALRVVEAVVLRLDESEISQRKTEVYKLKNTPAVDVASAISNFLQTQRQVETADPGLVSPFEQIEREVIVVPEPVSNSLLLSATPRFFDDVKKLVIDIDMPPKQVLIQALLVEVQLDNADEWGVELGLQDSVLFDRSLISTILPVTTTTQVPGVGQVQQQNVISATGTPAFAFNNQELGNNVASGINTSKVGGQGLTSFNLGRVNGDLGYGGLVLAAGSESVSALLRAVAARRRVDILSRPQIRTLDNQDARIQVGRQVPRISSFALNQTTGFAQPIPTPVDVGIILQCRPRVTPENMVVMYVQAQKNELSLQSVPLFVNPDGSTVNSPIIDTTNAYATISVKTGQTIVLGGMITKRNETNERKVPLLGDIPILGQAFRYDYKRTVRTELLIFLTPRVVTSDAEAERIKEIEAQRLNFIEAEAEMVHGPLFGVPEEMPWTAPVDHDGPTLKTPATLPPNPPAPGIAPMSVEDADDVPTTVIPAGQAIPDEDLTNADLSRKKSKPKKGSAVVPAGFNAPAKPAQEAGRSTLGPSTSKKSKSGKSPSTSADAPRKSRRRTAETE